MRASEREETDRQRVAVKKEIKIELKMRKKGKYGKKSARRRAAEKNAWADPKDLRKFYRTFGFFVVEYL